MHIMSENSDDGMGNSVEDVDPFQFKKIGFKSKRKYDGDSSSNEDDSDDDSDDDDSDDGSTSTAGKMTKNKALRIDSDSSDSESSSSGIEIVTKSNSNKNIKTNSDSIARRKINEGQQSTCLDLQESSDEEDDYIPVEEILPRTSRISSTRARTRARVTTVSKGRSILNRNVTKNVGTLNALKKAQEARQKLQQVQKSVVDTTIDSDSDSDIEMSSDNSNYLMKISNHINHQCNHTSLQTSMNNGACGNMGPSMKIFLRTSPTEQSAFKIRSMEPFEILMTAFRNKHQLPVTNNSIQIHFHVDGETVRLSSTPLSYDLEDEDLVDVIIKNKQGRKITLSDAIALVKPTSSISTHSSATNKNPAANTNNAASISQVVIKTRIIQPHTASSSNMDLWQIRCTDPFEKLISAFAKKRNIHDQDSIVILHNDRTLGRNSTPFSVGMKGGNSMSTPIFVDVKLISDDFAASKNINSTPVVGYIGNKVTFKLRINGKDESIQELSIGDRNAFRVLIQKFCQKNSKEEKDVSFILDGEKLNPNATPQREDLEGGEILDVIIIEKSNQSTATGTSRNVAVNSSIHGNDEIITIKTIRNKVCWMELVNFSAQIQKIVFCRFD